ncbi:MAG: ABC transporter permease [Nitrososphaerota archaeon]|jgi:ABC-type nitrate/sulfonate/bicarbonate transport system permease component|nr:ABC transporter permease [Nitrososphaerota archaeon]
MSEDASRRAAVSETGYAVSSQASETKRKRRESSTMNSLPGKIVIFLISITVFVVIWQVLATVLNDQVILAPPLLVVQTLASLLAGNVPFGAEGIGNIYSQIGTTVELIVIGYLISLVGIPIGIVMGRWRSAEGIIDPWINALWAIPMVALTPLIYPLTGGTFSAAILVVVLISIFTIIVNTYSGVKYTSNSLAEVGKTYNASEFQFMTKIVLPASLPEIVAGMRLGLGRAVLGAVVAEVLVTFSSLGQAMIAFQDLINTPAMMSIVFIVAIIGIVALQTPKLIEHYAFKWKETERMQRGFSR